MARAGRKPDPNAPTPQRLAKGDVVSYTPRDFGDSKRGELAPQFRANHRRDDPLKMLAHLLNADEIHAAGVFTLAYERTLVTGGVVNLEFTGGRSGEGLSEAKCRALGEFGALCRSLESDPCQRAIRCKLLLLVLGQRRTLSSLFPQKGRDFAVAKHMLISSIQRLTRHLEMSRNADDQG